MTDDELQADLFDRLSLDITARDRVRIEWQLNIVSARIIQALIATRFDEISKQTAATS